MLKFEDIVDAPVGKLKAAVDDWAEMVTKLERLAEDARDGMKAKADKAEWEGVNAGVTKGFIGKTAKEFGDAVAEAKGVKMLLAEGCTAFRKAKDDLVSIVHDEGPKAGVHVDAKGKVTARHPLEEDVAARHDPDYPQALQKQKSAIVAWQKKIDDIVDTCNDADQSLKNALTANVSDGHDFSKPKYEKLDQEEAARAAALAAKGNAITHTQLQQLNELLRDNKNSQEFSTEFYRALGPKKSLEFYGQLAIDPYDAYGKIDKERLRDVQELQKNLGINLAKASHDKKFSAEWGPELRKLGTQQIEFQPGMMQKPYGYQILGGLLRYGNYDPDFINPIAEHVTQLHQEDRGKFLTHVGSGNGETYGFNPSGKLGSGEDPLNSVLEGLGHSPQAAEKFFTDPPTAYNEDGSVKKGGKLDFSSYLDVFTDEEFEWNADSNDAHLYGDSEKLQKALNVGPEALGHALESATTGRPYDSDATGEAVKHSAERANLVHAIVEKFGESPELIRHNENGDLEEGSGPLYAMRGSLGDISAEYINDFQRSLSGGDDKLFSPFGESANLSADKAQRFLSEVGQDPDAYASITSAQQASTANAINEVINGDSNSSVSDAERLRNASRPGGIIAGIMSESRADAVLDYHSAADKEFNEAAAEKQKWADRILGMGLDKAAERVPILGAPIGWASEDIQESIMKSIEQDSADQAEGDATRVYHEGRSAAMDSARSAVEVATRGGELNADTVDDLKTSAANGADDGHTAGAKMKSAGDAS
ncbi:hypothetical protein [Streptomyces sp. NPDC056061]|uniref:hypothetical protein n=1 Tax=Streptomyces sp. NPDC056061 TaxID=3345700 RepID=UPI0035E11659